MTEWQRKRWKEQGRENKGKKKVGEGMRKLEGERVLGWEKDLEWGSCYSSRAFSLVSTRI